jgi:tetratricopeptide (TPR) repeat protein
MSTWWLAAIPCTAVLLGAHFLLQGWRVEREIMECHYARALKMIDGVLGWSSVSLIKLQKAAALFYWGRCEEAELILHEFVDPSRAASDRLRGSENLGLVLLALGRYPEAKRSFEAAAALRPTSSAAYSGLAELRLRQGLVPTQALADAERALKNHRTDMSERFSSEAVARIRGNQAWALALLGHAAESQRTIDLAAREIDPKHRPERAGFHWRAGMAMLAIDSPSSATDHFHRASELDPEGYYGGLARQQLRQQSLEQKPSEHTKVGRENRGEPGGKLGPRNREEPGTGTGDRNRGR